jgi:hypothetical protein
MVLEQFFLLLESEARLDPSRPHQLSCKYGEKKPNPPTLEIRQGIGHPGIQKPLKGWATRPGALVDREVRMFGITGRRADPGNLRQVAALYVASELIEQMLGPVVPCLRGCKRAGDDVDDLRARRCVVKQGRSGSGSRVLIEVKHRIVGEVAGEAIARPVPEIRREGSPGEVLVDLPAHAGSLQHFGERLPDEVCIGLEFEPACVEFYKTERSVRTASSEQVRQPIFRDGLLQWRISPVNLSS